jgi:uncharacterized membrane protein (UPF0136 family)
LIGGLAIGGVYGLARSLSPSPSSSSFFSRLTLQFAVFCRRHVSSMMSSPIHRTNGLYVAVGNSVVLAGVMGFRAFKSGKFMPPGFPSSSYFPSFSMLCQPFASFLFLLAFFFSGMLATVGVISLAYFLHQSMQAAAPLADGKRS